MTDPMNMTDDRVAELTGSLAVIRARLSRAAEAAGRGVEEITPVSYTHLTLPTKA